MDEGALPHSMPKMGDREREAAQLFEQYDLLSPPRVVDENERLVGVAERFDDVVDVNPSGGRQMDIKRLGGGGGGCMKNFPNRDSCRRFASRFSWLLIKSGAPPFWHPAVISPCSIGDHRADGGGLAVLMPIVASMGGNAGTQTMTVTVRALADAPGILDIYLMPGGRIIRRGKGRGRSAGGMIQRGCCSQ